MRTDTMWRDPHLAPWHAARGIHFPAEGMTLPMIEYDHGMPVGLVSYISRNAELPTGGSSYRALAGLHKVNGEQLPFITAQYDPSNWAMRLIGHNQAGRKLIGVDGWKTCTEYDFVSYLYWMRGRPAPFLENYGVSLSSGLWYQDHLTPNVPDEDLVPWTGADMSQRRRSYEPVNPDGTATRFSMRNPCTDIDLLVPGSDGRLRLVVDYKSAGVEVHTGGTTHAALGALYRPGGHQVPYLVARTRSDEPGLEVLGVNQSGQALAQSAPGEWRQVSWDQWANLLGTLAMYGA